MVGIEHHRLEPRSGARDPPRVVRLHDAVVGACRQAGFEPRLGPHAPQLSSALALVAAETGVTVVPASMATEPSTAVPTPAAAAVELPGDQ